MMVMKLMILSTDDASITFLEIWAIFEIFSFLRDLSITCPLSHNVIKEGDAVLDGVVPFTLGASKS